jgi:hypothetical protein
MYAVIKDKLRGKERWIKVRPNFETFSKISEGVQEKLHVITNIRLTDVGDEVEDHKVRVQHSCW